jgi:hypothetical protein
VSDLTSTWEDASALEHYDYAVEAGSFLTLMDEMAPQLALDYSVESLQRLDQFISEHFEPPGARRIETSLLLGVGSYLGEVLVRQLDGAWAEDGKPLVVDIEGLEPINPLKKAQLRFQNGKQDSLAWVYHVLHKKVGEMNSLEGIVGTQRAVGFFNWLKSWWD